MDILDEVITMDVKAIDNGNALEQALVEAQGNFLEEEEKEIEACLKELVSSMEIPSKNAKIEQLPQEVKGGDQKLELKVLPPNLK
jgi:hypothetical protein